MYALHLVPRRVTSLGVLSMEGPGTPLYMSPEHFTDYPGDLDERSEIYSLCMILYELLHPEGLPLEGLQGEFQRPKAVRLEVTIGESNVF